VQAKADPFQPSPDLVRKLGAIVSRADRFVSPTGGMMDLALLAKLLEDPDVRAWLREINRQLPADRPLFRLG
jgi:hypothetical protein